MYTITLNDGTKIDGLTLKNNCLVSSKPVTVAQLAGKLNPVTIAGTKGDSDDEDFSGLVGSHAHMEVVYIKERDGSYYIALADIPNDLWDMAELKANVAYIAMMSGITL